MSSLLRTNAALTARTRPLTGDVKTSFVIDDHMGWLKCDGRAMDKTAFNLLFQVIGYTFGGSGQTFNLPNPQGRVMASVGPVTDINGHTAMYTPGQMIGELDHKLTVPEMPSHNHDTATPSPGINTTAVGNTSTVANHTHGVTDPGHAHSYVNQPNAHGYASANGPNDCADNYNVNQTTSTNTTGISINAAGAHNHQINSNGGDQYHNNVQPTIVYGNSYIYSGIPTYGTYPFTTGRNPVLI